MSDPESTVEELTLRIGTLQLNLRSSPSSSAGYQTPRVSGTVHISPPASTFSTPLAGPRAAGVSRLGGAAASSSPGAEPSVRVEDLDPWTFAWKDQLILAQTPEELIALDYTPVGHLVPRLRATVGVWTPAARIVRALRAGVIAAERLAGRRGFQSSPTTPLANKIFVVIRGAPGYPRGYTEDASLYFRAVGCARPGEFHPESISHSFATQAEAQAYCIGAGAAWPLPRYQAGP